MRPLSKQDIALVSGAGRPGGSSSGEYEGGDEGDGCGKNNNGYGNGPESGPPPGNSGAHNPTLTTWNSGPRGPR